MYQVLDWTMKCEGTMNHPKTDSLISATLNRRTCCAGHISELTRLRQGIATINRWTDYCNNREIIVSDYWLSQKHRKIIGPDGLEK